MLLKTIILLTVLIILSIIMYLGPIKSSMDVCEIGNYINNKTVFYYKTAPQITCTVKGFEIHGTDKILTLQVTYGDGNTSELITTLKAFQKLWIHMN